MVVALTGLLLSPAALAAQSNNATINATANVLTPLDVTAGAALDFGNVFPGVNATVDPVTDANAGRWDVAGASRAGTGYEVTLDYTLPATLSDGGSNTMPIVFSSSSSSYGTTQGSSTTVDPNSQQTVNLPTSGNMSVWMGGEVQPPTNQASGSYSAGITLTVNYTGN